MSPRQEQLISWSLVIFCVALVAWNLYPRMFPQPVTIERVQPEVVVSISGAVMQPGVYALPWGSKVEDLVTLAGGLRPEAEASLVNLAMPLDTGTTIFVPTQRTETGEERISLNEASLRELESLPGIGPVLAQRIVEARPFSGVDELIRVSGIGPKILERLRPLVKL